MADQLRRTPLHDLHLSLGAKMVPFAGYAMPVQYERGIMSEHVHTRALAGLFDVSHMGQLRVAGAGAAAALETLVPGDIAGLAPGRMRYTVLTNDAGGIRDDLMVTAAADHLFLVVNAACKEQDVAHLRRGLAGRTTVTPLEDRALIALQGPAAAAVLAQATRDHREVEHQRRIRERQISEVDDQVRLGADRARRQFGPHRPGHAAAARRIAQNPQCLSRRH